MLVFGRFLSLIMSLIMAVVGLVCPERPVDPEPEPTVQEGEMMEITRDYVIVRGANAASSEVNAASKLQGYLKQIASLDLPVVTDDTAPAEKEIIVGKTNREGNAYTVDREKLGDEGVMIKTVGEKLVIAGGEKRGTLYSVYEFLYKYLDCRWYTHDCTVIPTREKIEIPKNIDYTYVPIFEYRETDWISPRYTEYSLANHLNANSYRRLSDADGSTFGYANGLAHTMAAIVPSSYFETDPEMFALGVRNGKRTTDQPCLTNPKTLEVAIKSVREILKNNPDGIVSVTQNDNMNYCVCENCKRVDEEEGSHAGTMIRFINAIAENIAEDYPNASIDTFAYQYTRQAPKITKPLPNVIVRICSIECCFAHPISDSDCEENISFKNDIEDWQEICGRIYLWDYTTNYANYLLPFPDFGVIQDNMQFFAENNVKGVYEEGNYTASESNGEFAELRAYLLSRLMWDPYMDYDTELWNFCKAYYGEAGPYVKEYVDMTTENTGTKYMLKRTHMFIYSSPDDKSVLNLSLCEIHQMDELWEKAKNADLTEEQLLRVRKSEISWRFWKACNRQGEYTLMQSMSDRLMESKKLYDDLKELGIVRLSEGSTQKAMLSDDPNYFDTPNKWNY